MPVQQPQPPCGGGAEPAATAAAADGGDADAGEDGTCDLELLDGRLSAIMPRKLFQDDAALRSGLLQVYVRLKPVPASTNTCMSLDHNQLLKATWCVDAWEQLSQLQQDAHVLPLPPPPPPPRPTHRAIKQPTVRTPGATRRRSTSSPTCSCRTPTSARCTTAPPHSWCAARLLAPLRSNTARGRVRSCSRAPARARLLAHPPRSEHCRAVSSQQRLRRRGERWRLGDRCFPRHCLHRVRGPLQVEDVLAFRQPSAVVMAHGVTRCGREA